MSDLKESGSISASAPPMTIDQSPPSYAASVGVDINLDSIMPENLLDNMDIKQAKLRVLCDRHNIDPMFQSLLWNLNEKHIIFLCDDSGSMNSLVDGTRNTRWDELKHVVTEVLDISLIFDPIGMDVHFLNRNSVMNVKHINTLVPHFRQPPSGGTPLISKLTAISQMYQPQTAQQTQISKLLIIATDGEPSDDETHANYPGFKNIIRKLVQQGYHIGFLICTDHEDQVEYINDIDRLYTQVDVTDDYQSEKRQIQSVQGKYFNFSYGDYIVKLLVGSIDRILDNLDEHKLTADSGTRQLLGYTKSTTRRCTIL